MVCSLSIITASYLYERSTPCRKFPTQLTTLALNLISNTCARLIGFLINFVRGSYQDELDKFFQTICRFDVAKRVVSKAALTKARMKLRFEAFAELDLQMLQYFETHFNPRTWR